MSRWLGLKPKASKSIRKLFSLVGKPKDQQAAKPVAKSAPALELDDDLPF
jgi:hypothetical protein